MPPHFCILGIEQKSITIRKIDPIAAYSGIRHGQDIEVGLPLSGHTAMPGIRTSTKRSSFIGNIYEGPAWFADWRP
jgi:hypothetical protein